ncbi:MAG: DUF2092 domain-containing protein [Acetobacteraceae bacterium]|nr:DUF2092 domain-containing protein [Acetobacteraceae bacterium]
MRIATMFAVSCAISAVIAVHPADAQSTPAAPSAHQAPANTVAPAIAEQAETLLKQMSAYVGSAEQFTFHAEVAFDHVVPSGQKLQFSAAEEVALQRPGDVYVEWSSDLGDRQFWYDGKSVTLYDPATSFYASDAAPPDIDAMLDNVVQKVGFSPPLSDLLYSDPYLSCTATSSSVCISASPM